MNFDLTQALGLIKEGGSLILLALVLFKWVPRMEDALNRVERVLFRIEGKLGIKDTDRLEQKTEN